LSSIAGGSALTTDNGNKFAQDERIAKELGADFFAHGNRSRKRHAQMTRTSSQGLPSQEFNAIVRATIGEFSAAT